MTATMHAVEQPKNNPLASGYLRGQFAGTVPSTEALPAERADLACMTVEDLPFSISIVRSDQALAKATHIRAAAYSRHLPDFAKTLEAPEREDFQEDTVVILVESKADGAALGTMRIQTNDSRPLCLQKSIDLPAELQKLRLAEATRLGVTDSKDGRLVKYALFKAYYLYCWQIGVDWMVIAGRSPIDRQYGQMLFSDVYPGRGFVNLMHASNLPHRIMSSQVNTAEQRWEAAKHPLFDFAFRNWHPDIDFGKIPTVRTPPHLQGRFLVKRK